MAEKQEKVKKITKINPVKPQVMMQLQPKKRVCAYCRVSTYSREQQSSFTAQTAYYEAMIGKRNDWQYAGIYADEARSGMKLPKRNDFLRMMKDCEAGKIDMILTKSVTRFARNTVDSIQAIRKLKLLGIAVFFEKENINTLSESSEMLLTILSSLAQGESESISTNNKWAAIKRFQEGTFIISTPAYGYTNVEGELTIDEQEAETVRHIFKQYLNGKGSHVIARELTEQEVPTIRISTLDCSNFTNPYQMLEFTKMRLADYSKPRVSYVLSAMDLSVLTGYEHEQWALGDIVTVDDRDLNMTIKTRVIRRQYNLQEPWKTVLELSSKLRELGDSSTDVVADQLNQSSVVQQEVKDMVPFNHLRNSRADNGFAYWQNSGFEVDIENGVSGTASFKATGVSSTKSIAQTVYPSSRRSYTISAQIGSENLQKGTNGQVGIEVVFEFEDGTTETRFIDLF